MLEIIIKIYRSITLNGGMSFQPAKFAKCNVLSVKYAKRNDFSRISSRKYCQKKICHIRLFQNIRMK
jgi:hypothetical protein